MSRPDSPLCRDPVRVPGSPVDGCCNRWHVRCDDADQLAARIYPKLPCPCSTSYGVVRATKLGGDFACREAVHSHFSKAFRGRPVCGVLRYFLRLLTLTDQRNVVGSCRAFNRFSAIKTRTRAGRTCRKSAASFMVRLMFPVLHPDGGCQLHTGAARGERVKPPRRRSRGPVRCAASAFSRFPPTAASVLSAIGSRPLQACRTCRCMHRKNVSPDAPSVPDHHLSEVSTGPFSVSSRYRSNASKL